MDFYYPKLAIIDLKSTIFYSFIYVSVKQFLLPILSKVSNIKHINVRFPPSDYS